jgi:hypothetical protein
MKRLMSKIACAALGLGLAFGASASPRIPVALAPVSAPTASLRPTTGRVIIVIVIVTRAMSHTLENVDQSQFDRTN